MPYTSDDFDAYLAEQLKNPEFAAAYADATTRDQLIDQLVDRRKAQRLTQTEVGHRMGNVRQATVSGFEREGSDPRLSTLQRYARAVGARLAIEVAEEDRGAAVKEYLTVDEVAAHAGVTPSTITAYNTRGQMPRSTTCPCCGLGPVWARNIIEDWRPVAQEQQ